MKHPSTSATDKRVLGELALRLAGISSLPVHEEKRKMWSRLNKLQDAKPPIWINEICWNEMNVNDELTLRTSTNYCREIETRLRRIIYQWDHLRGDIIGRIADDVSQQFVESAARREA